MNKKLTQSFVELLLTQLLTVSVVIVLDSVFSLAVADGQIQYSSHSLNNSDQAQQLSVLVDGQRIYYRQSGAENAPVILMLQGSFGQSPNLQNMLTSLSDRFHIIAPYFPVSESNNNLLSSGNLHSHEDMAGLMDGFITKLGVSEYGLLVMNHAMPIAVRLILNNPQQVRFLLLKNGDKFEDHLPKISASIQKFWARKPEYSNSAIHLVKPAEPNKQKSHSNADEAIISLDKLTAQSTNFKSVLKPVLSPGGVFKTQLSSRIYFF